MPNNTNFSNATGDGVVQADGFATKGQNYVLDSSNANVSADWVYSKIVSVTLAELNAGKVIIAAIPGRTIKIVGYTMIFNGTFTTATDIRLQDSNSSPVLISTVAIANATAAQNANSDVVGTGVTNGAGCFANLTASKGVSIAKTGSSAAGGTSIMVKVLYNVI